MHDSNDRSVQIVRSSPRANIPNLHDKPEKAVNYESYPYMLKDLHEARVARRAANPALTSYDFGKCRVAIAEVPGAAVGSIVWEGCHVLCRFLESHPELVHDRRVLELGSGVGLAGLAAACLGATRVFVSEAPALLPLLVSNIERNRPGPGDRCTASELVWGEEGWAAFQLSKALAQSAEPPEFDIIIIAADVVYRDDSALTLVSTLTALASTTKASTFSDRSQLAIVMAYKERGAGAAFFAALSAAGFTWSDAAPPDGVHRIILIRRDAPGE